MTVTLQLSAEIEATLVAQAAARGLPFEVYLQSLIEEAASQGLAAGDGLSDESIGHAGEMAAANILEPEDFSDWAR